MILALYPDEAPGDPGTTAGGIVERAINMACCEAVTREASRRGLRTIYTPNLGIDAAIDYADRAGADIALVIAHNFSANREAEGSQFLFCDGESQNLLHQGELMNAIGSRAVATGLVSRYAPYVEAVAWCCAFPRTTVFWEVGFQSNAQDLARILVPGYADQVAEVALDGIESVLHFTPERPAADSGIRWGYFSGQVDAPAGANRRLGPGTDFGVLQPSPIAQGTHLGFDGYTHRGAPIADIVTGAPDDRWFHIDAQHGYGWVASALINGNPDF